MASVTINIRPLLETVEGFKSLGRVPSHPAFEAMFVQWTKRYESFSRRRYNQNATGGGDWAPLALSTIKARNAPKRGGGSAFTKRGGGRSKRTSLARDTRRGTLVASPRPVSILKDTGVLFASLTIGGPGNRVSRTPGAITYAIGGEGKRQVIAGAHQSGNSRTRMPARRILVPPNAQTLAGIRSDAVRAVRRLAGGQR